MMMTSVIDTTAAEAATGLDITASDIDKVVFEMRGPRGAHYALLRNYNNPNLLYPVNMRNISSLNILKRGVRGFKWFIIEDDQLTAIS